MGNQENHQPAAGKQRFYYGYIVVIASFFIMMFSYGVYHSFGIFFKPILYEFGWTRTITSGPFSFSWVIHSVASLFMGYLYDKFGPRMVITLCGLLVGIGYLLMSQVSDIWHLYLIYGILIGTGSATFTPITSAVAKLFIKRRTVMTGISTIGIGFGSLVIPIVAN